MLAATAARSTPPSPYQDAIETLFGIGGAFLWTALTFAVTAALVALYLTLRPPPPPPPEVERAKPAGFGDPTVIVDAFLKLPEGLAKAPAWLAMFVCGAVLFWIGSAMSDEACGNAVAAPAPQAAGAAKAPAKPTSSPSPAPAPTPTGSAGASK